MFESIIGNDLAKKQLSQMVKNNTMSQSLLFAGPEGVGKSLFALELANHLLNNRHTDLHIYKPEGKIGLHSIESMRTFCEAVYMSPMESKWKIFIIEDADRMLPYSANALLKTFEEPALDSIIILLSNQPDKLLPTIRSRCRTIRFAPIPQNKKNEDALRSSILDILIQPQWASWAELSQTASSLATQIEKEAEEMRTSLTPKDTELSATQKQALEKEIDGIIAMRILDKATTVFHTILSWFRDLELIHVNGNASHIINNDHLETLNECYQSGHRIPIAEIQQYIKEAMTALDRSTPFSHIMENLFLKLKRI